MRRKPVGKIRVLFIGVKNSARSQIAETYLRAFSGALFEAESAGVETGEMDPLAIRSMIEDGYNIAARPTKTVTELLTEGKTWDCLVLVCDDAVRRCPPIPGRAPRFRWSLPDPERFPGSEEERLEKMRDLRDAIKTLVTRLICDLNT